MFESVLPEMAARRRRLPFYESLPVSIAVHGIAIAAVALGGTWKISFPHRVPHLLSAYRLIENPVPPPPPPPPPAAQASPAVPAAVAMHSNLLVAPSLIPDAIPEVLEALPVRAITKMALVAAVVEQRLAGMSGGIAGGVAGGMVGGDLHGVAGGKLGGVVADGRVYVERDRLLPMHPLSQEYPSYPEDARLKHWEDSLVVRYVIGKNGRVREVTVLSHADRHCFEEETLRAIAGWRFKPLIKDGQAVEVVHELTVNFRLV